MEETTKGVDQAPVTETITEEALLKSLTDLEGKKEDPKPTEPVVVTTPLVKSVREVITEKATEQLRKAMDASGALKDFSAVIGLHVDESLATLQKSIQAAAERDSKMITVLVDLKKSIDANTAAVKEFGAQPTIPASDKPVQVGSQEILQKSTPVNGPKIDRAAVLGSLTRLTKSASAESDRTRFMNAAIKFESTGSITDEVLMEVKREIGK